ncbi:hypothetical protein [Natronoglycomyces albus]|uniref:Uncharacterized protein n=1 Tax=Natronoglycomyces albus TaxID=2811108 RepID=A0A895XIX1_9ACTN|nr:hypothetical protein [Natronoglycomyces albus]QSB05741.1 hypothetical protein JQS30_02085 [Natronoglycomyces albus]
MQVFCGIVSTTNAASSDADECAVALVGPTGTLLVSATVTDDPRGWVHLSQILARHADSDPVVMGTVSRHAEFLTQLATASGYLVAAADERKTAEARDALDGAISIARGLASGALPAVTCIAVTPEIAALRPILDSIQVVTKARQSSAEALTCLLRAVFPAVLAAWDDPAEPNAVAILTRLPQPGALQEISTEDLAADLATVAEPGHVAAMVSALTAAIEQLGGGDDPAVAPAVSATAEAVAAWDRSLDGLMSLLTARRPRSQGGGRGNRVPRPRRASQIDIESAETIQHPGSRPEAAWDFPAESASGEDGPSTMALRKPSRDLPDPSQIRRLTAPASAHETGSLQQQHSGSHPTVSKRSEHTQSHAAEPGQTGSRRARNAGDTGSRRAQSDRASDTEALPASGPRSPEQRPAGKGHAAKSRLASEFAAHQNAASGAAPRGQRHEGEQSQSRVDNLPPIEEITGGDDGLLIFGQTKSAWFKRPGSENERDDWSFAADEGWKTAQAVTEAPEQADTTNSGLPRRKPQANLVPGSMLTSDKRFDEPINRDAELLAQNTSGYFKGWGRARGSHKRSRRHNRMAV